MDPFHQIRPLLDWLRAVGQLDRVTECMDPNVIKLLRQQEAARERLALDVWNSGGPRR